MLWPTTPNGGHERGSVRRAEVRSGSATGCLYMPRRSEAEPRWVLLFNPASSVWVLKHVLKNGKTPGVLGCGGQRFDALRHQLFGKLNSQENGRFSGGCESGEMTG